ncbi:MAG TPA: hypothetical protein PLD47_10700 [Aggregatilineales bacterium]|nr:hypothetical protein [Anaerolineales bacterium]HRE48183.1 hypothetical protein [Aggregatilineales bacterium]
MTNTVALDKLENIAHQARQSAKLRNDPERFVIDVAKQAKQANLHEALPMEHIEALAAEHWIAPIARGGKLEYPLNILEIAIQRRNHKLMLKLLRHPNPVMRTNAAEQFQILFSMLDGYYDEASALVNQILLMPTEIPEVKYALLRDAGRSSRRGLPREVADTARRLIHDLDQGVSYHALRLLSYLHDSRDWKAVLDRMLTLMGDTDDAAEYFLAAGVDYLGEIIIHEPSVVEWIKGLEETYPPNHMANQAVQRYIKANPDAALQANLITRRDYKDLTGN